MSVFSSIINSEYFPLILIGGGLVMLYCIGFVIDYKNLEKQLKQKEQQIKNIETSYKDKLEEQEKYYNNFLCSHRTSIPWLAGMMADFFLITFRQESKRIRDLNTKYTYTQSAGNTYIGRKIRNKKTEKKNEQLDFLIEEARKIIAESKASTYKLEYLVALYPEFEKVLKTEYKDLSVHGLLDYDKIKKAREKQLNDFFESNKDSMPWLAGMMADYLTYDMEFLAQKLEWGENKERTKKVAAIREIRAEAKRRIEEAKLATYQLEYLKRLYPALEDVLEVEYKELDFTGEIPEGDPVKEFLSKEEWNALSTSEKNQLALDRYVESRKKSKWQIGRDYELSVAWEYIKSGFEVDTHGSYMGLEDMGRDIIAKKDGDTTIIQCKYWGKEKLIHEKHIFQLFGSIVSYCMETGIENNNVNGLLVTNIAVSDTARKVANYLNIKIDEHHEMVDFPRIKCNIGHAENGREKIYHLPMDEQYDNTKIDKPGEFYAFTVKEAEEAGFRRAYKHIITE